MLKNKNYFCAIVSMYSTCSLVGSTINFQRYSDEYGIWSAGTMIVAPVLNEAKVPFLAFALTSEDVTALPENLSGLVWKGEIGGENITNRLFKILKDAESNDEKKLKEQLSIIESCGI